jgi:predicted dehydrogenase
VRQPLRLGLLSTARINEKLVAGARLVDEVDVVAIGSRDLARAEAQASSLGIKRALGSFKDPWHSLEPELELRAADGSVEEIEAERIDPYACELRYFAAAVAGGREPLLGRADAAGQARAIAALHRSAESGQMVRP